MFGGVGGALMTPTACRWKKDIVDPQHNSQGYFYIILTVDNNMQRISINI